MQPSTSNNLDVPKSRESLDLYLEVEAKRRLLLLVDDLLVVVNKASTSLRAKVGGQSMRVELTSSATALPPLALLLLVVVVLVSLLRSLDLEVLLEGPVRSS